MTFEEWWAENGEAMLNVNLPPKTLASLAWNWGQTQQRERDAARCKRFADRTRKWPTPTRFQEGGIAAAEMLAESISHDTE